MYHHIFYLITFLHSWCEELLSTAYYFFILSSSISVSNCSFLSLPLFISLYRSFRLVFDFNFGISVLCTFGPTLSHPFSLILHHRGLPSFHLGLFSIHRRLFRATCTSSSRVGLLNLHLVGCFIHMVFLFAAHLLFLFVSLHVFLFVSHLCFLCAALLVWFCTIRDYFRTI